MSKNIKGGLGRGLSALLASENVNIEEFGDNKIVSSVSEVPISQIEANPFQPRTEFEKQALEELADSIKLHGIIQPVTLRKMGYEKYQLISGERRTRAAILAGLTAIPAYVRIANDQDMLEMALIENIQRENLNAIEIALSYKRLLDECDLKQEELGERVGKDRSTVANYMRLLKLPDEIQAAIKNNELSMGHARSILGLKDEQDQLALFHRITQDNLSVRATEQIVKEHSKVGRKTANTLKPQVFESSIFKKYSGFLKDRLTLKVGKGKKGQLLIKFNNENELEEILEKLH
ncbi:MAG: ParB/RepB/Spo0J family partition protein [Bacteroidia bacterium]|nr:ParB/RepB/Spo0J family partition protein [Bacteroidia bacterium]MCO5254833.1 ParB/RepB/Spo0J family partition protein [Bacteroidota bacterium]